ncbi:hypothetical protein, partial [Azospirillum argentinense]|uniref:hypothetical protein n=1 Tax=Azospirillum argentinense TaxID=2970906 RepID=UPI001B3BBBD1
MNGAELPHPCLGGGWKKAADWAEKPHDPPGDGVIRLATAVSPFCHFRRGGCADGNADGREKSGQSEFPVATAELRLQRSLTKGPFAPVPPSGLDA